MSKPIEPGGGGGFSGIGKDGARSSPGLKQAQGGGKRCRARSTEERILQTAEALFAEHGFDAISTKQLACCAGVSIGALYHHFEGKEALYDAAAQRAFSRSSIAPLAMFHSADAPEIRLRRLVAWFIGSIVSDRHFGLLLQRELLDPRPGRVTLVNIAAFQEALCHCKALLSQLIPDVEVDKAVAAMLALSFGFANLKGLYAIVPSVQVSLATPDEIAAYATCLLLDGLRAPPLQQSRLPLGEAGQCRSRA